MGDPESAGRKGGVAVDLDIKAAADETAVSSSSPSLGLLETVATGDGRKAGTAGERASRAG